MSVTRSRPARANGKTPALLVFVWGICLTEPILKELRYRVQQIAKSKPFMGADCQDYGLVFCLDNGSPVEPNLMEK